jgi:uncharacterized protein YbaP (TraB family)
MRRRTALLLALLLAACAPQRVAHPALWEVTGPGGQHGWLLGTMHVLPPRLGWRTATISQALSASDTLVVEAAGIEDAAATRATFNRLARANAPVRLDQRVDPALRPALTELLHTAGADPERLAELKTWAAALVLAQLAEAGEHSDLDAANGADRVLLASHGMARVVELEGVAPQLAQFDRLDEAAQRRLLATVITDAPKAPAELQRLAEGWARGDTALIEGETRRGLLADDHLRAVLFVERNQAWAGRLTGLLAAHRPVFVAVGAAHMAGPDGLVALMAARGYTVRRVQ